MSGIREIAGARSRRILRRSMTAGLGAATAAAAAAVVLASPAAAAQPNNQACLGHDVRAYAQAGSGFGALVSGSLAVGGVGEEIQAHLAGNITDDALPNSCND